MIDFMSIITYVEKGNWIKHVKSLYKSYTEKIKTVKVDFNYWGLEIPFYGFPLSFSYVSKE